MHINPNKRTTAHWQDRAAAALDATHSIEGRYSQLAEHRHMLAAWLDGAIRLQRKHVRYYVERIEYTAWQHQYHAERKT